MTISVLAVSVIAALPVVAAAQDTRAAVIVAEQAEKATRLHPYVPNRAEAYFLRLREKMLEQPAGFYPYFDSVYNGGGFTVGGGYRTFTGDRAQWHLAGLYSVKGYKLVDAAVTSPGHASGRIDLRGTASWRDATQVAYHGMGMGSPADADTGFRMQETSVGGDVTVRPHRWLLFTGAASFDHYSLKDPTGSQTPVDDVFVPDTAPGLGANPGYLHTTAAAAFDWRPAADYARRGGMYRVARHDYSDLDESYSFSRLDAEVVQHVPLLRENWVISVHGRLQSTLGDDTLTPYFLLPALGSGSTLRAYSSFRFRDRHAVLLSGEWRWIPSRMVLDMAVFYDTGMVAPRLESIAIGSFASNVGVGVRFHTPLRTPLRIEVARGAEGLQLVFAASSAF